MSCTMLQDARYAWLCHEPCCFLLPGLVCCPLCSFLQGYILMLTAAPHAYLDLDEPTFAAPSSAELCQGVQANWCTGCIQGTSLHTVLLYLQLTRFVMAMSSLSLLAAQPGTFTANYATNPLWTVATGVENMRRSLHAACVCVCLHRLMCITPTAHSFPAVKYCTLDNLDEHP